MGQPPMTSGWYTASIPPVADLRVAAKPFLDALAALDLDAYARTKARILAAADLDFEHALTFSP